MGVENIVQVIKEIHPEKIILIKIGNFYNSYGKDSYIISYLFNYQIKLSNKIAICGFPKVALNKVLKNIEDREISYILVNKSNNYEEEEKMDFKKKNMYLETYDKAYKYLSKKRKIDNIYNYLLENINDMRGNSRDCPSKSPNLGILGTVLNSPGMQNLLQKL